MPFGAPGFFRDKALTRKPTALEVSFLYDQSGSMEQVISFMRSPSTAVELQLALQAEGVGVSLQNRFSQADHQRGYRFQSGGTWVEGASLLANQAQWGQAVLNGALLGANTEDVTGGSYFIATLNPRDPSDPASSYRGGLQRTMVSFSNEQTTTTRESVIVSALTTPATAQIFVGVGSLRFGLTTAAPPAEDPDNPGVFLPSTATLFGAVFLDQSTRVIVVGESGGQIFYGETPLSTLIVSYGAAGNQASGEVTTYTTLTQAQITNGPVILPGATFQRINTPHLAYRSSGAIFDITHDISQIAEALGQVLGRYLYELT